MSQAAHTVNIQLLGNHYQIACTPENEQALRASADYLDKQMRQTREKGNIIGLDRIAVMVALNAVHELLQSQSAKQANSLDDGELNRLNHKLDKTINRLKQLQM